MIHATLKALPARFEITLPTSKVQFPFTGEPERTAQLAAARSYLETAVRAGAKLKIKEVL